MALSLNALTTQVQKFIQRTSIGSNPSIQDMVLRAIIWLESLDYWPWRFKRDATTITLGSGTWEYSLPGDFGEDLAFRITEDNKEDDLDRIAFEDFIRNHPDPSKESGGQPTKYTIGYKAGTSGAKRLWIPHPADGTYATELLYWEVRTDAVSTTLPSGLGEVEKICLVHKAAAMIEGGILKQNNCNTTPTCECNACQSNRWLVAIKTRKQLQRIREKPSWKHPKKSGIIGETYDVRGHIDTYNV